MTNAKKLVGLSFAGFVLGYASKTAYNAYQDYSARPYFQRNQNATEKFEKNTDIICATYDSQNDAIDEYLQMVCNAVEAAPKITPKEKEQLIKEMEHMAIHQWDSLTRERDSLLNKERLEMERELARNRDTINQILARKINKRKR